MSNRFGRVLSDSYGHAYMGLAVDHSLLLSHPRGGRVATVRFWRNPGSVVVGRGQSLEHEVDRDFCQEKGILVCRRISGGGAVYQDEGNLNISLVYSRGELGRQNDVREATRLLPTLIRESLERCGLSGLTLDDFNGIYLNGHKVSGAASYLTRDTVLVHSTLLLSADLEKLERSLLHSAEGRHRKSRYAPTMNLPAIQVEIWKTRLIQLLEARFDASFRGDTLTPEELEIAEGLSETMYSTDGWISEGKRPGLTD